MAPKRNISFLKPPEPAFIKRMKESLGYQEPPTVETKKQRMACENEDREDIEDEQPVVVVLNSENISKEEMEEFTTKNKKEKIKFSKPAKKDIDEKSSLDFSSRKKELQKKIDSSRTGKAVKNSSLLSFDDDEEEC